MSKEQYRCIHFIDTNTKVCQTVLAKTNILKLKGQDQGNMKLNVGSCFIMQSTLARLEQI